MAGKASDVPAALMPPYDAKVTASYMADRTVQDYEDILDEDVFSSVVYCRTRIFFVRIKKYRAYSVVPTKEEIRAAVDEITLKRYPRKEET
jgi:hypothetical protein